MLIAVLSEMLKSGGIKFVSDSSSVRFSVQCGSHRLAAVFEEDDESFLRGYIRYPWKISERIRIMMQEKLNQLNIKLRAGCFFIDNCGIVFRYGVYIFDEYTARETIVDLLITGFAAAASAWNGLYEILAADILGENDD